MILQLHPSMREFFEQRSTVYYEPQSDLAVLLSGISRFTASSAEHTQLVYQVRVRQRSPRVSIQIKHKGIGKTLAVDVGDLRSLPMRKRLLSEVQKRYFFGEGMTIADRRIPSIVESDLEGLVKVLDDLETNWLNYLLNSMNDEQRRDFQRLQWSISRGYSRDTVALLGELLKLPADDVEGRPSRKRFTVPELASVIGATDDQVRGWLSPLIGRFVKVIESGRGNKPTVYSFDDSDERNRQENDSKP